MSGCQCEVDEKVIAISGQPVPKGASQAVIDRHVFSWLRGVIAPLPDDSALPGSDDQRTGKSEFHVSEADLKALGSEFWFKQRFGFTLGRRGRLALFEVIDDYDLTDAEVRSLARSKCIAWDGQTLRIRSSKLLAAFGIYNFLVIAAYIGIVLWGLIRVGSADIAIWIKAFGFVLGLMFLLRAIYKLYVEQLVTWIRASRRRRT